MRRPRASDGPQRSTLHARFRASIGRHVGPDTSMRERLQALLDAGRDDALLRFGLGTACLQAGDADAAVTHLAAATRHDPEYSAAWKLLGKALLACGCETEAEAAWRAGLGAAARRGDVQSSKEMTVFLRRIARGRQAMS